MKRDIVIPATIALVVLIATAYINTKIKFALSEAAMHRDIQLLVLTVLCVVGIVFCVYKLFKEGSSTEPVTRSVIISIALNASFISIFVSFFVWFRFLTIHNQYLDSLSEFLKTITKRLLMQ